KEYAGEERVHNEHGQQRLNDRGSRSLAHALGTAFHMQSSVARDRNNDPCKNEAFNHSRIQIPGIGALQGAHDITSGVEVESKPANGPSAEHSDVIAKNRKHGKHHEHGEKPRHDEIFYWVDRHYF